MRKMLRWLIFAVAFAAISVDLAQAGLFRHPRRPPIVAPKVGAKIATLHTIDQSVDNFNTSNTKTWQQRYYSNDQFFKDGGPMFVYIGGEWAITADGIMSGQIYDMAEEHEGYMFYLEHRFYGRSFPTADLSVESLKFLSKEQALEDLANFIRTQKESIPGLTNSKVVAIGGSYSAALATWSRLKIPDLVDAAYASSAPLEAIVDFYRYNEVVNDNLLLATPTCAATIQEGMLQMQDYLETEDGNAFVTRLFRSCKPINAANPYRAHFFTLVTNIIGGLVQNAFDGSLTINCTTLENFNGTETEKLAKFVDDESKPDDFCFGDYDDHIALTTLTGIPEDENNIDRQWTYQDCAEFGYFQTTTSEFQPYGNAIPLEYGLQLCEDLYGDTFTPEVVAAGVAKTNEDYGGLTPDVTKVVQVHGTGDPWYAAGAIQDINDMAPAILVPGTSHCADLASVSDFDIPEMRDAKLRVQELIREWIR